MLNHRQKRDREEACINSAVSVIYLEHARSHSRFCLFFETDMKKILLIFLLVLNINAQDINFPSVMIGDDKKPEPLLKGKVHNILISSYRNGNLLGDILLQHYDSKQRLKEIIKFSANIEVHTQNLMASSQKTYYSYSAENKFPIEYLSYDCEKIAKRILKYQDSRLVEELSYYGNEKLTTKIDYVYNDSKKEITILRKFYIDSGQILSKNTLQYNEKKQWTKKISYEENGKISDEISFEYDPNGLLKKVTNCCEFNFYHTYEYVLDAKRNWIERKEFYSQKNKEGKWETSESLRTYRVITYLDE